MANEKDLSSLAFESRNTCISVLEGYERWAEIYDTTLNPVLALEERYLEHLIPDLVRKNVLDLACGTGRWIPRLLARGARRVIGIDLSAAMLRVAGSKAGVRERVVLGDCAQLPFPDRLFDFALCSFALNHLANLDVMARELARVLKGSSRLLITDMHPNTYEGGWRTGFRDERGAAQIETVRHTAERVIFSFVEGGFACLQEHNLVFGEPELPIFLAAGKTTFFENACRFPAVKFYEFRRVDAPV